MRKVFVAGLLVVTGMMTTGLATANADEIEVNGDYASQAGCQADAPNVEITHNDHLWTHWDCRFGNDGFWHVWLSN